MPKLEKRLSDAALKLKEIRESLGLNQVEMAARIGTSHRSYHGWERGRARVPADALLTALRLGGGREKRKRTAKRPASA